MENKKPSENNRSYTSRRRWPNFGRMAGWTLAGVAFATVFGLVFGLFIKWLWNAVMPGIFGLGEIGYWQAVGLVLLTKLLFGSFGNPHAGSRRAPTRPDAVPMEPWSFCQGDFGMKNRFRKWHYYHQFWTEEGQAAFDNYVERMENAEKEPERHDQ